MLTAFLVIGGVGLALLVISLIVGEVHGALFDWIDNDLFSGAVVAAFLSALGFVGALVEGTSGNSTTASSQASGSGSSRSWPSTAAAIPSQARSKAASIVPTNPHRPSAVVAVRVSWAPGSAWGMPPAL